MRPRFASVRGLGLGILLALFGLAPSFAAAAPTADLHEIKWFVHTDLVTGGTNLAFYEALLDDALEDSRIAFEGNQGPYEGVCCNQIVKEEHSPGVTLATFGSPADGLDVVDSGEYPLIQALGGSGSRGFLVDSVNDCGGGPAIGCADLPTCDNTPDDDPDLVLVVTMDASDSGVLGLVIAHERGHNACLDHVITNNCELMRGSVNGGCVTPSECAEFADGRTASGGTCACHTNGGVAEADATACIDGAISGVCSGGICGETPGDASIQLMAAGGPGAAFGNATDDPLLISAIPGGWEDLGAFGSTLKGLAHDEDSAKLYGIEAAGGDDVLVIVDATTGSVTSTVGTVSGHPDVISLAFDPGPTAGSGDDRLLALSSSGGFETLIELDPANANVTVLGPLDIGVGGSFQGLAYDSINEKIYASGFAGGSLFEIDESACGSPFCTTTEVLAVDLSRIDSGLAFSAESGALYLVGRQSGSRILYNAIDASTFAATPTMGVDQFTIGGLAAIPVPEPAGLAAWVPALALLQALARRRRSRANASRSPR